MRPSLSDKIREQVRASYDLIASKFDQTRQVPWEEFHHFLGYVRKGDRVLDLGCGNGRLFAALQEKQLEYTGVDQNEFLLSKAREKFPQARWVLSDMVETGLPEEAFDVVFSVASFHHLPGKALRKKGIQEMHRVLKPEGLLILTVWDLFQWRYAGAWVRAFFKSLLHLGFGPAWNDLFIAWGSEPLRRYYHAFTRSEIESYFEGAKWEKIEYTHPRFNHVLILRKK